MTFILNNTNNNSLINIELYACGASLNGLAMWYGKTSRVKSGLYHFFRASAATILHYCTTA